VKHVAHKQSLATTGVNLATLAIGASDVIFRFQENPSNPAAALENLATDYSAGLKNGSFDWNAAVRAYGPLLGALGFKKAMSFLLRRARIKM